MAHSEKQKNTENWLTRMTHVKKTHLKCYSKHKITCNKNTIATKTVQQYCT